MRFFCVIEFVTDITLKNLFLVCKLIKEERCYTCECLGTVFILHDCQCFM